MKAGLGGVGSLSLHFTHTHPCAVSRSTVTAQAPADVQLHSGPRKSIRRQIRLSSLRRENSFTEGGEKTETESQEEGMALCDITEDDLNELMREEAEDVFFDGRGHPGSWGLRGAKAME